MVFINGIRSILNPTKIKIIGLLIPIAVIVIILFNRNFQIVHPVLSFLLFWSSIPLYIYFLGMQYKKEYKYTMETPNIYNNNCNPNIIENNNISHVERKTKTIKTTTMETTETIFFKEGNDYD